MANPYFLTAQLNLWGFRKTYGWVSSFPLLLASYS
jgi:hypothetical protein